MSKNIEEYIREHKKAFDLEVPSNELWDRIEQGLKKEKKTKRLNLRLWLGMVASLVVISTFTFMYIRHLRGKPTDAADVNASFGKREIRFVNLIDEKKDSLKAYAKDNPDLYNKFSRDLGKLDQDYAELKKELQSSPNRKLVIEAMVQNLEIQLQIINQQLSVINQVNTHKGENKI